MSCKVLRDPSTGISRGVGFVQLSTPEEATKAISEMNSKLVCCLTARLHYLTILSIPMFRTACTMFRQLTIWRKLGSAGPMTWAGGVCRVGAARIDCNEFVQGLHQA